MSNAIKSVIIGGFLLLLGVIYFAASRGYGLRPMQNASLKTYKTTPTDTTYRNNFHRRNFRSTRFYSGSGGFGK